MNKRNSNYGSFPEHCRKCKNLCIDHIDSYGIWYRCRENMKHDSSEETVVCSGFSRKEPGNRGEEIIWQRKDMKDELNE